MKIQISENPCIQKKTNTIRMSTKTVILVRHGQSTANRDHDYGPNAKPDPSLTPLGISQAQELIGNPTLKDPDLVVVSPLSRAVQTAHTIYEGSAPYLITPLHTERWSCRSDEGVSASKLGEKNSYVKEWQGFDDLPEDWTPTRSTDRDWYTTRVPAFIQFLRDRDEEKIVVIGHGGIFGALVGRDMRNCEIAMLDI